MVWWQYILIVGVLLAGIYGFVVLTGYLTGFLSHRTDRTAESMYGDYADSPRKQRRYAQRHGGQWHDEETRSSTLTASQPRPPRKAA